MRPDTDHLRSLAWYRTRNAPSESDFLTSTARSVNPFLSKSAAAIASAPSSSSMKPLSSSTSAPLASFFVRRIATPRRLPGLPSATAISRWASPRASNNARARGLDGTSIARALPNAMPGPCALPPGSFSIGTSATLPPSESATIASSAPSPSRSAIRRSPYSRLAPTSTRCHKCPLPSPKYAVSTHLSVCWRNAASRNPSPSRSTSRTASALLTSPCTS